MIILENIIKQEITKAFILCEIKIDIDDLKKRGFATQVGQMYATNLKAFQPLSITGKIGIKGDEYEKIVNKLGIPIMTNEGFDASYFSIKLKNGDILEIFRNTNPAYAYILLNGDILSKIKDSSLLFRKSMPEIVKKEYGDYIFSKSDVKNK